MKKAYSYQRFSEGKQKSGDSIRRQTHGADEFCKTWKLELIKTFRDEGVSGFRGKNFSNESALSAFLKLVDDEKIEKGSVLIVENMDRLSRQSILPCMTKFMEIIQKGIGIGVISQNKILDTKSITDNPMELMLVLVEFSRANNESEAKSKRTNAVLFSKIEKMKKGEKVWYGAQRPKWIIDLKNDKWIMDDARIAIVKDIFKTYLRGASCNAIAVDLNKRGIPSLMNYNDTKRRNTMIWSASGVMRTLRNDNVLGHCEIKGVKVESYYPSIISTKDFLLAQNKLDKNRINRGGSKFGIIQNVFKGLLFCSKCGYSIETKVTSYKAIDGKWRVYCHYACRGVIRHSSCDNVGRVRVDDFEKVVLSQALHYMDDASTDGNNGNAEIEAMETEVLKIKKQIGDTLSLMDTLDLPEIKTKLEALQIKQKTLIKELANKRNSSAAMDEAPNAIATLRNLINNALKAKVSIIREILDSIGGSEDLMPQTRELRKHMGIKTRKIKCIITKASRTPNTADKVKTYMSDKELYMKTISDLIKQHGFRMELRNALPLIIDRIEMGFADDAYDIKYSNGNIQRISIAEGVDV